MCFRVDMNSKTASLPLIRRCFIRLGIIGRNRTWNWTIRLNNWCFQMTQQTLLFSRSSLLRRPDLRSFRFRMS